MRPGRAEQSSQNQSKDSRRTQSFSFLAGVRETTFEIALVSSYSLIMNSYSFGHYLARTKMFHFFFFSSPLGAVRCGAVRAGLKMKWEGG